MITAHFTQFILPDGRKKRIEIAVADDLDDNLALIDASGLRLECEVLTTGDVSFTITNSDGIDYDIELVANGHGVPEVVDKLIRRFTISDYEDWFHAMSEEEASA